MTTLKLMGAPGSPYSRKMRSLLRYRRIPFRWILMGSKEASDLPPVPVPLIPVLVLPGKAGADSAMIDSTFQIGKLEELHAERSVLPSDPAVAFVDALIEDYADEWLTKAMFHYRWAYAPDIAKAASILPRWGRVDAPEEEIVRWSAAFRDRQVGRLGVVGSNPTTAPVIESSYRRLLRALDEVLQAQPFVMGRRPGTADFGLFGQLTQLALFDPTAAAVALEESPRVLAWCDLVEDLSGLEIADDGWLSRDALRVTLAGLLAEVGRTYAPFLLANAAALERGAERVECEIDGRAWVQKPFPYQAKCLRWLRDRYAALATEGRAAVDATIAGTGCEALFTGTR